MIMTFAALSGRNGASAIPRAALFTGAYLCVWSVASAGGALAQAGLSAITARAHDAPRSSSLFLAVRCSVRESGSSRH